MVPDSGFAADFNLFNEVYGKVPACATLVPYVEVSVWLTSVRLSN